MTSNIITALRATAAPSYRDTADFIRQQAPLEPAYLFCRERLARRAERFRNGFPGTVSYAVKANPEPRVLRTLADEGITHFDVASPEEIRTVLAIAPGATLHYNNPIKAREAIAEAYGSHGVRSFAVDEVGEMEKIHTATGGDPEVCYTVRFRLAHSGAAYDFGSKFGATPEEAAQLLRRIAGRGCRTALTFHPGSQCTDPQMYARYIDAAADIIAAAGVTPELLNVGGGFPEYYLGTELPELADYFDAIAAAARAQLPAGLALMCEPGRGMVGSCVSLLARVVHVRDCGRRVFINDGVYGGMQEQSLVDLRQPVKAWRDGQPLAGVDTPYQIFGPTCDPVDRLRRETVLPAGLAVGDYIEFGLLGAYGSVTATRFNGFCSGSYVDIATETDFRA